MSSEEGKLTTPDGLPLYWKAWIPQGKPRAVVQVIHGYGEHINRYMNVVEELLPAATPCWATTTGATARAVEGAGM